MNRIRFHLLRLTSSWQRFVFFCCPHSSAGSAEQLKIAIPALASSSAPYWIAVDRGFLKVEGLEVELPLITAIREECRLCSQARCREG